MSYNQNNRISDFAANNVAANFDVDWDVDKYRDEHECEEHWQLRKAFMEKWKNDYPEDRLVCLARVFTNIEFMGCRYPQPVMQEIARLSFEVGRQYREQKKSKLQRTFVSASDAAEDRAKGIKRMAGEIVENKPNSSRIAFVPQGTVETNGDYDEQYDNDDSLDHEANKNQVTEDNVNQFSNDQGNENKVRADKVNEKEFLNDKGIKNKVKEGRVKKNKVADFIIESKKNLIKAQIDTPNENKNTDLMDADEYIDDMRKLKCLNVREFRETMFQTTFGRMVLLIRPWARKLWNMQTSCQVCGINLTNGYVDRCYSLCINGQLLASATGETKVEARNAAEDIAWERLRKEVISVVIKEQFIAQGDARITVNDVSGKSKKDDVFGTPVENSVAMKMMKMMGWQGGGLGAEAQGIAEPIKPNLQMVNRAGLGSANDVKMLRRSAHTLMNRYIASDTFDVDLVFSSDFTKVERALLHQCAQKIGLASRSYGEGDDRFLVVKKKLNPFTLVRAIIERGGTTPKYQVFIPATLKQNG